MRARLPMWAPVATAAAVIALAAWSAYQRWQLLAVSPFPLGVDGYFYPIQLRALLEHGALAYPASPLAFYLMAPFAAVTDPITGAKLAAALLGAAIAFPAYGLGARLGGGRGAGLIAAALATTSTGSLYLTVEFVKNGIGLTVALTALWLALRAADRPSRTRIAAALTGLACACATHKMAAALALLVAVPAALAASASRGALRGRRLLYAIAGVIVLALAVLAVGAAAPQRFLSADDAPLFRGLVSATPHWTAPALVFSGGQLTLGHDALLGLLLALAAVIALVVRRRRARTAALAPRSGSAAPDAPSPPSSQRDAVRAAAWPILLLAIAIGLPFLAVADRQGLGFRLRIAAFVPAALSAAIAIRAVLPPAWRRDRLLAAAALAIVLLRPPDDRVEGEILTHPALVAAAQALTGHVPAGATLIIPERHIAFLVAWYTRAPIAIRPERVPRDHRLRLLPLHFIGEGSALDRTLIAARAEPSLAPPLGVHPRHPNGLVLVPEATWEWVLAHLPPADRARFARWPTI